MVYDFSGWLMVYVGLVQRLFRLGRVCSLAWFMVFSGTFRVFQVGLDFIYAKLEVLECSYRVFL